MMSSLREAGASRHPFPGWSLGTREKTLLSPGILASHIILDLIEAEY
jgi:hypothetical protein